MERLDADTHHRQQTRLCEDEADAIRIRRILDTPTQLSSSWPTGKDLAMKALEFWGTRECGPGPSSISTRMHSSGVQTHLMGRAPDMVRQLLLLDLSRPKSS